MFTGFIKCHTQEEKPRDREIVWLFLKDGTHDAGIYYENCDTFFDTVEQYFETHWGQVLLWATLDTRDLRIEELNK